MKSVPILPTHSSTVPVIITLNVTFDCSVPIAPDVMCH